jgi:hypothetical protein
MVGEAYAERIVKRLVLFERRACVIALDFCKQARLLSCTVIIRLA